MATSNEWLSESNQNQETEAVASPHPPTGEEGRIFRRRPAPGKPKPLLLFSRLRLAAADANSSRNQQVARSRDSRAAAVGGRTERNDPPRNQWPQVAPPPARF
nr:unnamed protein product [Digitaria exilis]